MSKSNGRLYKRGKRWWADFRDFADVGGAQEAMKPAGASFATDDEEVAEVLAGKRLAELQRRRLLKATTGLERTETLRSLADLHLKLKAEAGKYAEQYLSTMQVHLERAVEFLGGDRT